MDEVDLHGLDNQNKELATKNMQLNHALASMSFNEGDQINLIQYQLETDKILERIEHFLKGHTVSFNEEGAYFDEPKKEILVKVIYDKKAKTEYLIQEKIQLPSEDKIKDPEKLVVRVISENKDKEFLELEVSREDSLFFLRKINALSEKAKVDRGYRYIEVIDNDKKPFNDYGVSELMRIISMYLNKETFLSQYTEERVMEIMNDLGNALNDFLFTNYEKMGMDTKFKESKYSMICLNILHSIESCYRRAIGGAEQENIRTRSIVTQNQGPGSNPGAANSLTKQKWHAFKPSTW